MSFTTNILHGQLQEVANQLQGGADVNEIDVHGYTPLIEAAIANNKAMAELLLQHGAEVNAKDVVGGTALHWAAENNNIELCELLLKHGADVNAYNRFGQPVLLNPILRRQQELKELLYEYGADLKFAQDYINTKLIGHRFELTGRIDIVDPTGKFVEMDFEGFILEFTIAVIHESLLQFKNNFSARIWRDYFKELHAVIDAYAGAAELIKYQQYMTDLTQHQHRINELLNRDLVLIPVGYAGHAITFIKYRNLLVKCDRGENSLRNPSVGIYRVNDPLAFNADLFKFMLYKKQNKEFVTEEIFDLLKLQLVDEIPLQSQMSGNCSWANTEAALPAMLYLLLSENNKDLVEVKSIVMQLYEFWCQWDQDWALHQCIESFYDANKTRKASKAAILAAVLFQRCNYNDPKSVKRAEKVLAIISQPEYRIILDSYLKVYLQRFHTQEGKNLLELIDLYSR